MNNMFSDRDIIKVDGKAVMMTQEEAIKFCKEQGGHLPTTREWAMAINPAVILEVNYVENELKGVAPKGYYRTECDNDGVVDIFYFKNSGPFPGEMGELSFWTSSKVLGKPGFGHVVYGKLGGGGGPPADHAIDRLHCVLFKKPIA